jgi:hypothetical protein
MSQQLSNRIEMGGQQHHTETSEEEKSNSTLRIDLSVTPQSVGGKMENIFRKVSQTQRTHLLSQDDHEDADAHDQDVHGEVHKGIGDGGT